MTGTGQGFDENAWAANRPQERLVWVDCEMTGLDLSKDVLVEIAVLVTEADLTPLDDGIDVVIRATREQLAGMDPFVVNMHTESGLLPLIDGGEDLAVAETRVLEYVQQHVPDARKASRRVRGGRPVPLRESHSRRNPGTSALPGRS